MDAGTSNRHPVGLWGPLIDASLSGRTGPYAPVPAGHKLEVLFARQVCARRMCEAAAPGVTTSRITPSLTPSPQYADLHAPPRPGANHSKSFVKVASLLASITPLFLPLLPLWGPGGLQLVIGCHFGLVILLSFQEERSFPVGGPTSLWLQSSWFRLIETQCH